MNTRKSRRALREPLLTLLLLLLALPVGASSQPEFYSRWMRFPSRQLVENGQQFFGRNMADSALVCYSIVASRYDKAMTADDKRLCVEAWLGEWNVYFLSYFDFSKAYESLTRAKEVADEMGWEYPLIYMNFGGMYHTLYEQGHDLKSMQRAFDYYQQGFYASYRQKDYQRLNFAFTNLINITSENPNLGSLQKEWKLYQQLDDKEHQNYVVFNRLMYEQQQLERAGHYDEALALYDRQAEFFPQTWQYLRFTYTALSHRAQIQSLMGRPRDAIASMHVGERLSVEFNSKDIRLDAYQHLVRYYRQLGDSMAVTRYRTRYLDLKDSIMNFYQLTSVKDLEFLMQMKHINEQMADMKHRRQMQDIIVLVAVVMALVVSVFLAVVFAKNRRLRRANQVLYEKNVALLRSDEALRYKNSSLNEDDKDEVLQSVMRVMENSDEVCSADFTAERLALLSGYKQRQVSQVIREKLDSNFNALLNDYRVREACRRINNSDAYDHLTIEAIANDVGFKSRTTFIASFKHATGLTPSEYLRQAKAQRG